MSERDVSDRIAEGGTVRGIMEQAFPPPPPVTNHAKHAVRDWVRWREALEAGEVTLGVPSRWPKVTEVLGGGYVAGTHLVGAAEGFGKSTYIEQEITHMVRRTTPVPCGLLSLEMRKSRVIGRIVCRECGWGTAYVGHEGNGWSSVEWSKAMALGGELTKAPLWVEDFKDIPDRSISSVIASLDRMYAGSGGTLKVAAVDHFHKIDIDLGSHSERAAFNKAALALDQWSKDHDVALLIPVQLTKSGNDPANRPALKDVREAAQLAMDCESAVFLRARDQTAPGWNGRWAIFGKTRDAPGADVPLWACAKSGRIEEHTNTERVFSSRY